jgi:hypothetical protein
MGGTVKTSIPRICRVRFKSGGEIIIPRLPVNHTSEHIFSHARHVLECMREEPVKSWGYFMVYEDGGVQAGTSHTGGEVYMDLMVGLHWLEKQIGEHVS